MTERLYVEILECCSCGRTATKGSKHLDRNEPIMVSITPVIYRRGQGKGQLKNAPKVTICEDCLISALTAGRLSWTTNADRKLWTALQQSFLARYSTMREEDANHA